jgi:hypothetical protein
MRSPSDGRQGFVIACVAAFLIGLLAIPLIPVYDARRMLDFHNLFAFHHCEEADASTPYEVSGAICGDEGARPMIYPPVLYWAFSWVRLVDSYALATVLWLVSMLVLAVLSGVIWAVLLGKDRRARLALGAVWIISMTQFPMLFALERGNNDVLVLFAWSAVAITLIRGHHLIAGLFAGLAVAAKIYPALAVGLVLVAVRGRRSMLKPFASGAALSFAGSTIILWPHARAFVEHVIPEIGSTPLTQYSHSLFALSPSTLMLVVALVLLASWLRAAARATSHTLPGILAGSLAISTYFSAISYDYNLVTAMPLVLATSQRAFAPLADPKWQTATVLLIVTVLSGRILVSPTGNVILPAAVLAWIGHLFSQEGSNARTSDGSDA